LLPIDPILPEIRKTLEQHNRAVLVAPPGAGKTTKVPLAMLEESWLKGKTILMLEPRRLAARSAAHYMAMALGQPVGQQIGYRVRGDTRVSAHTRIEVITEGILPRMLQEDPALEHAGLIIFDEFHERSIHSDLGLALALQAQSILRDDLRLLIMSATLDGEELSRQLGNIPLLVSEGRSYPVETRYSPRKQGEPLERSVTAAIRHAIVQDSGDVLVFLPGIREIRSIERLLREHRMPGHVDIMPLYSGLSLEEQEKAIAPAAPGTRKIVLSTSIAETSLTVEGIRVVIDSGLMRVSRFSPRTGLSRLETVKVTQAAADQRRGRAGRQGPGVCYRLWTMEEERRLEPQSVPEILQADLLPLALELAVWGVTDPHELFWLNPPPPAAFAQAQQMLENLGAIDAEGKVTSHGRRMADLGIHPRLAHMIWRSIPLGLGDWACDLAAILQERDFLRPVSEQPLSLSLEFRLDLVRQARGGQLSIPDGQEIDRKLLDIIIREADALKKACGQAPTVESVPLHACGLMLAFAYPDRIAQRKDNHTYLLRTGRGAILAEHSLVHDFQAKPAFLVAADLDDQGTYGRIRLTAVLDRSQMYEHFRDEITQEKEITWDRDAEAIRGTVTERLGAITLKEKPLHQFSPEETAAAVKQAIADSELRLLSWTKQVRQLQQRIHFVAQLLEGWPNVTDEGLLATLDEWLEPYLYDIRRKDDLAKLNLADLLLQRLTWEQRQELDRLAPSHLNVPSGSKIAIDYTEPAAPVLAVKLQEMFGCQETPRIGGGRVPVVLHLLSPAGRPIQITRDLANFWQTTYFDVRKDLRGRYPKHYWPENPLEAVATNRTKPRPAQ